MICFGELSMQDERVVYILGQTKVSVNVIILFSSCLRLVFNQVLTCLYEK